ncbi:hypothetical protein KFV08_02925 [Macrococcoides canis]|uniref:hypothetical protein n=3 Tax=Macrococcoides canis TaxID=1855823 RepID=UPI0020B77354|nr:hypothetical protein [Macrococcus canis]UTH09742.1 hypothetical protein KFV08_02925 [Macrococcus canis]
MKKTIISATFASLLFLPATAFAAETTETPVEEVTSEPNEISVEEPMMTTTSVVDEVTTMEDTVTSEDTSWIPEVMEDAPVSEEMTETPEYVEAVPYETTEEPRVTAVGEPVFEEDKPVGVIPEEEKNDMVDPEFSVVDRTDKSTETVDPGFSVVDRTDETTETVDPGFSVVDRTDKSTETVDPGFSVVDRTDETTEIVDPGFSVVDRTDESTETVDLGFSVVDRTKNHAISTPSTTSEQVSHSNAAPAQVVSEEHSSLPMTGEGNHKTIYAALLAVAGLVTLRLFKK